jgi:hypothetical protein
MVQCPVVRARPRPQLPIRHGPTISKNRANQEKTDQMADRRLIHWATAQAEANYQQNQVAGLVVKANIERCKARWCCSFWTVAFDDDSGETRSVCEQRRRGKRVR